jgi:hypothetical protein
LQSVELTKGFNLAEEYLFIKKSPDKNSLIDKHNEQLTFEMLNIILKRLSIKHNVAQKRLIQMLQNVSGSLVELKRALSGKETKMWSDLEDIALRQPITDKVYKCLVKKKGLAAVNKRKEYLQID